MAAAFPAFVAWGFGVLLSIVFGWSAQFGEPGDLDGQRGRALYTGGADFRRVAGGGAGPPTLDFSRAVLLASSVMGVLLVASLLLSGARELVDRRRRVSP